MKKSWFTEQQIAYILKQIDDGVCAKCDANGGNGVGECHSELSSS